MGRALHGDRGTPVPRAAPRAPPPAAAVYVDDVFVPFELSMATAHAYRDVRPHITNFYQHDGIGFGGAEILGILRDKVRDH